MKERELSKKVCDVGILDKLGRTAKQYCKSETAKTTINTFMIENHCEDNQLKKCTFISFSNNFIEIEQDKYDYK